MNITKLFLLASAGLAAVAFTPAAQAHEGHHHHKHHHHGECTSCTSSGGVVSDRPYYYTSNPDVIYVNPSNNNYRGASDWVVLIGGHRAYRNHRAN